MTDRRDTGENLHLVQSSDAGEQLLRSDGSSQLARRWQPEAKCWVLAKRLRGNLASRHLAHEAAMLQRLAPVPGVSRLEALDTSNDTLLLTDDGSVTLEQFLTERHLEVGQVVGYARALAHIVAGVHAAGVLHQDICPAKLLIHPQTLAPTVGDFDNARLLMDLQPGTEIIGTWAYLSPEQTGRSGRTPDQRSDLYSLGVTLYQLLTGCKPFTATDLLELVHDHLVRIPAAPCSVNPAVPAILSELVMRLLEKDPDRRYQSADGLAEDLERIGATLQAGTLSSFELGQFDFGIRLEPPRMLVGRATELATLRRFIERADPAQPQCLLVSGGAGTGKSALLEQLRPLVAAQQGWLVVSKFDPFRQDAADAALAAFQLIGRQLLAQPEATLVPLRESMREALGSNLGIGPALLPEFELLLGKHPAVELSDPREAEARTVQAALDLLRCVASPARLLVLVYEDLHWAPGVARRLLDAVVSSPAIPGLLFVCSYRDNEVATDDPLRSLLEHWRGMSRPPGELQVGNLAPAAAAEFIAAVLHLPGADAASLSALLAERTQNNPYDTLELLNALRQDNLLVANAGRWTWDAPAIRRHVGNSSVADILNRRIAKLPEQARELLQALACLGGQVTASQLSLATGLDAAGLQQRIEPSLNDGLLVNSDAERPTLRLVNQRVQQAVLQSLSQPQRVHSHLALARRLVECGDSSETDALAAEQYLAARGELRDLREQRLAVELFERAARRLRLLNSAVAEGYLAAALELLTPMATTTDAPQLFRLNAEHHRALFNLGRLEQSDRLYTWLAANAATPLALADSTRIQMYAYSNRRRFADALALGMDLLKQMGLEKPADVRADIAAGLELLAKWSRSPENELDLTRPEASDPRVLAWSTTIPHCTTPAYFCDLATWTWLTLESLRLWIKHGPEPRLMACFGAAVPLLVGTPQDFRGAYAVGRHMLRVGEARGYEPATSFIRVMFALSAAHWVEPIERAAAELFRARTDLMRLGDESFFAFTFVAFDQLFDYAPTLETAFAEIDAGLAVAARSGNLAFTMRLQPRKQMLLALRGATCEPGGFDTDTFDEAAYQRSIEMTGPAPAAYHTMRALTALLFGDIPKVIEHTAQLIQLGARTPGYYLLAIGRVLRAVALSEQARKLPQQERADLITEIDRTCLEWLAKRAADAPMNFLHLQRWVEAERAWAAESIWAAGAAFDAAVKEAALHERPWHRAIISERAALFHLSAGLEDSARQHLALACAGYEAWGATGKVKQLRQTYAFLRGDEARLRSTAANSASSVGHQVIDMMAVLRASQALSSETSLIRLTEQVSKVVSVLTGATSVRFIVRANTGHGWLMADSLDSKTGPVTVEAAGARHELPLAVFRYVERTKEPLVIDDVTRDARCVGDAYAERFEQCSLLFAPILAQGQLSGLLMLENDQRRAAFSAERLDSIAMIAGQLAVSLNNALLYASLENRVSERTAELCRKTDAINALLQNMPQGVLSILADGTVHPEYSAYLAKLLEVSDIAHRNVMELLFTGCNLAADTIDQIEAAIGACIGEDSMNYEFNSHLLIGELDRTLPDGRVKSLALSWSPICNPQGIVERLMLCVRDVTDLKRLAGEASARQRELQMIGEILAVAQDKFHAFMDGARGLLDANRALLESGVHQGLETAQHLFRNLHTLKGNARTYGLLRLSDLVHAVEQSYDALRSEPHAAWNAAELLEELSAVRELLEAYAHINDRVLGRQGPGRRGDAERFLMVERTAVGRALRTLLEVAEDDAAAMRSALAQVTRMLCTIGTATIAELLEATLASLPSLARELGKEPPLVEIKDHGIALRTQVSGLLRDVFTHLLRNAIDHGIEAPDLRLAQGKHSAGRIQLSLTVRQERLWIHLHDDGRGLALKAIHQRAIEQHLVGSADELSSEQIAQLVLRSGVSTAAQVTQISGRGVGLDAVQAFLAEHGGTIAIRLLDTENADGFTPFETVISLPDKYAASPSADLSLDALLAQLQAPTTA